jgi:ribosomal protein S27AE
MTTTNNMKCEECGVDMNHHADKIDYTGGIAEGVNLELGGVLQEVHTCPGCGKTAIRPAG